mgnify:FL=1
MENRVLLVDDEANVLSAIRRALHDEPVEVLVAERAEDALKILEKNPCKVVISDERMPGMNGTEFLCKVKELFPDTVRMLITGYASIDAAMEAVNNGEIYRFFKKPWNDHELIMAIRSALEKFDLQEENSRLLAIVRRQALELQEIEKRYPGISCLQKDRDGSIAVPNISEEERDELLRNWSESREKLDVE